MPSLGTNVDGVSYYTAAQPFLNLFKLKLGSAWGAPATWAPLPLDEQGWIKSLPSNRAGWESVHIDLLVDNKAAPPNTRYVVLYEGEGTLKSWHDTKVLESSPGKLVVQSGASGDIRLALYDTDPSKTGNYIKDIQVVREDLLAYHQAGLSFDPNWIARLQDLHTLRFMGWTETNTIFNPDGSRVSDPSKATLLNWEDRPKPSDLVWNRGVPVELMVELANRTGTDMWVNMPVNASDDYIRGFATYVSENLRADLKVHVEFSNEVWNWIFPQTRYADLMAKSTFGPTAQFNEWYGMRTAQVGQIWNEVFGEPVLGGGDPGRALIVFATQGAWHGLEAAALNTPRWLAADGTHIRAANYFDEYAITGYYYGGSESQLLAWSKDPAPDHRPLAQAPRRPRSKSDQPEPCAFHTIR